MAVVSTRTDRKRFQYLRRVAGQCRTGNRRRRTVPATEPKRAAVEIALGCTCATETRAAGAIPSIRGAPSGRPERPQSGGGDRCVAPAGLWSLLSCPAIASNAALPVCLRPMATDSWQGHRCRPDERYLQYTPSGRAPPVPSANDERC